MEEDNTWLLAYRYLDMDEAGEAYARARDIVFSEGSLDDGDE